MTPAELKIGNAELVGYFKQDSPEWHEARAQVIGGSDIAAVLGLSTYKSAYTLWHEKAGLIMPRERTPEEENKLTLGHYTENYVAGKFREAHPELDVFAGGSWRNRDRKWQGCNPDRLVAFQDRIMEDSHSLLELKLDTFQADWDEVPLGYQAQVRWQMDTFGFAKGYLAVYFTLSGRYREYEIDADPFDQEAVRQRAKVFAESLTDATEPPEIDGMQDTYETLRRLNPSLDRGKEAVIPDDIAQQYLAAAFDLKQSTAELTKWKGHLLAHMGTAQYAKYGDLRIASRVAQKDSVPYLKEA